jgi:hypothetical protein
MTSEQLTAILLAAMAAPGFWELLKYSIQKVTEIFTDRKRVTIEEISDKIDVQGKKLNSLEQSFMEKNTEDQEREAKSARRRILRADDYQAILRAGIIGETEQGGTGIYPCGEGPGYAGGIMSAAVDGLKVAEAVVAQARGDA